MTHVRTIFTIGHSRHPLERFIALLHQHEIAAIADVRSMPYSRWQPQFNQAPLKHALAAAGISYVFLGKELGARSDDRSCYVDNRVQYRRLAATAAFHGGLGRLRVGVDSNRIAVMCAEGEPLECHRTILVARELEALGVSVLHILPSGETETHVDALRRLRRMLKVPEQDLFRSAEELLELAYAQQEARIAYVDQDAVKSEGGGAF